LSIEEGKQLYRSLRGQVSGVALPQYVLDLPGGFGKVPVADLAQVGEGTYQVTPFGGQTVRYVDAGE
jgi:lysine 2,3-aminomutase